MKMPAKEMEAEDDGPPTSQELAKAITDDLTYVGNLCAAYLVLGAQETIGRIDEKQRALFRNALLEISLLFIRKSAEFFSPTKRYPDNLHAKDFLPSFSSIKVVHEDDYKLLHKAVGHITVRGARRGVLNKSKDDWPIRKWTLAAIDAWIRFFEGLPESNVFEGKPPLEEIARQKQTLMELAEICRKSSAAD